jgi:hypothetical protein
MQGKVRHVGREEKSQGKARHIGKVRLGKAHRQGKASNISKAWHMQGRHIIKSRQVKTHGQGT